MLVVDSDVLVDVMRDYPPARRWLAVEAAEQLIVPGFAAMELVKGTRSKAEAEALVRFLGQFSLHWPNSTSQGLALARLVQAHLSHNSVCSTPLSRIRPWSWTRRC